MTKGEDIDIYDLDETLLRGNSTRLYLDVLLHVAHRRWQAFTWLRTATAAALRLSRIISHRRYKWLLWHASTGLWHHILVATAAYAEVLNPLHDLIDGSVATETATVTKYRDYVECRGDEKARRARKYVEERGATVSIIYTDGKDDAPLMVAFPKSVYCIVLPNS